MKRRGILILAAALTTCLGTGLWFSVSNAEESPRKVAAPGLDTRSTAGSETAVLAGGCFWGVQGVFQHVKGVTSAVSGYAGGTADTATYDTVSTGSTGHAEAVRIRFDPRLISYGQILQIYFSVAHDPTQLNRQGPDSGTQYRSQIFTASAEQARIAAAYVSQLDGAKAFARPIATRIAPLQGFFAAEAYHQDYLTRHPTQPYIVINDLPKVAALRQLFPSVYRSDPVLVAGR
ncbi:peptide-methionine (S)-S-oxide reductase MsrA [Labrys neptuniae]